MTKDVLISISGLHFEVGGESGEGEPVEIITPASYYLKNGKHYVLYDEVVEGVPGTVKNTIKISTVFNQKINNNFAFRSNSLSHNWIGIRIP